MESRDGKFGPGCYKAILQLCQQQADTDNIFAQGTASVPPPLCKTKYAHLDVRIDCWLSPPQLDIDHNDVIDSKRLLWILSKLSCCN